LAAKRELDGLTAELEQVQSRIRETSPEYAALTHPAPFGLREIQTQVLDQETVLLEYALGAEKSFVWAVSPDSLDVFELPPRDAIESAVKHLYALLTARNHRLPGETPAQRAARIRRSDEEASQAAAVAGEMLLGPMESKIAGKRLLVVAEGALQHVPFGVLPEPGWKGETKPPPLIVNHEIVAAPSASVMGTLRRDMAGRPSAGKGVAILADPVFSADDSRIAPQTGNMAVKTGNRKPSPGVALPLRGGDGGEEFLRLRFSRDEADAIARLSSGETTLKAVDFAASRDTVLDPDFGRYRIVHFATHSVLDNEHPELSGIVLSRFDRSGRPQNGFLRLYEIYNLRLGADLVVLSACQTARGGEINGEGLIGLTRGFLYAGAPRVVASLWEVEDRATAEFMKRFYTEMLQRGARPAAALRAAQADFWRTKGWDAPYYWAAFLHQGEWR
jgi:CHAT domain-containing protein